MSAHVIAAAVKTRASIIITETIKDFPAKVLAPLDLEAKTSDAFLADTVGLDPGRAVAAVRTMRDRLKMPDKTAAILLLDMEASGFTQTVDVLREPTAWGMRRSKAGAVEVISSGGTAKTSTVTSGGNVVSTGVAVLKPGSGAVLYAAVGSGLNLGSNSAEYVMSGGTASATTITNGDQEIFAGGVVRGGTISGGVQYVYAGASTTNTVVKQGGAAYDYGKIITTTAGVNGSVVVASGGVASGTNIHSGGSEIVSGTASGSIVSAGGYETIASGGIETAGKIAGGTLEIVSGGKLATKLTFSGSGGQLTIDSPTMPTTTISGFASGDSIKLPGVTYVDGSFAYVGSAGVVTVYTGSSYNLNIAGATVGETDFHFGPGSILTKGTTALAVTKTAITPASTSTAKMSFAAPAATPATGSLNIADLLKTPVTAWLNGITSSAAPVSAPAPAGSYSLDLAALQHGTQSLMIAHTG
jgi:autotransporter passenger strand-loop-strand repeat protein